MMELEKIQALAQVLKDNDLSVLKLSDGEDQIVLKRQLSGPVMQAAPVQAAASVQGAPEAVETSYQEVKSPMVGVFYSAPSPDSEPFVSEGNRVKKGDVLCVIEAMKLMNEVNAESDGTVVEVCVENGQVVEYGQTLFRIT